MMEGCNWITVFPLAFSLMRISSMRIHVKDNLTEIIHGKLTGCALHVTQKEHFNP